MDYEILVKQFFQLDLEYSFTPNEVAIYFHLINRCSIGSWKNPFGLSCDELRAKIKCKNAESKTAFDTARNKLKQVGLIDFKNGLGRGNVTQYTIKAIKGVQNQPFSTPFSVPFSPPLPPPTSTAISNDLSSKESTTGIVDKKKQIVAELLSNVRGELPKDVLLKEAGALLNKKPDFDQSFHMAFLNGWARKIKLSDHEDCGTNGATIKKMVY